MNWKRAVLAVLLVMAAMFVFAPTSDAALCDLFHRHAASQGSTGGTYVAQREVTRTYSYGSAGGVPTQVLAAPRTAVLPRLRSILRWPATVVTVTPEAPAEPAKPVVGAKCDCGCPNCNCNQQEPLTAKKE